MNLLVILRSAGAKFLKPLRRMEPAGFSPAQAAEIRRTLEYWGFSQVTSLTNLGGRASSNYAFHSLERDYILRYYEGPLTYLLYQLKVVRHLAEYNFPYDVPRIRYLSDGSEYLSDRGGFWIVYGFIPGHPVTDLFEISRAEEVGALVAKFHSTMTEFSLGDEEGNFVLPMFQTSQVVQALTDPLPNTCGSKMSRMHRKMLEVVVNRYIQLPHAEISAVMQLPKQTIYNDWHGWNMLQNRQGICGIIDFDSIVEAPRVVDVQNALSYILISKKEPSRELVAAFLRQYKLSCPFEARETLFIQSVMIDRMLHIISDIQRESPVDVTRVELAGRMVRFLHWIVRAEKLSRWLEDEAVSI
ncbi:phosphotransferase [Microvirga sp. BSC39]|uniref:phosphotransferase enzyme family protein n=1 Tax=Microvirga sp. BSC39 TaxID=1549810 RepID=UPI0004E8E2F7|nr:phosphotransferase [Microvirga sp. BSC39]KFG70302.1 hypothetical protein JH26_05225 [Microvirga sp. BSC39]